MIRPIMYALCAMAGLAMLAACQGEAEPPAPAKPRFEGVQGQWQSAGRDVSPFLSVFAGADSIVIRFEKGPGYRIEQYDTAGRRRVFEGTYELHENDSTELSYLLLNQTLPLPSSSEGLVRVFAGRPDSMYLEVVQTQPYIGAFPPTLEGGFGSSSAGALGNTNIQRFRRIE
ncbi:MAG: hypothetical protein D6730_11960 [Bacteroidetes bacterium]|nr:MAG: hypothetical protein D6730_11960 [Bacteroidota bacterium]